MQLRNAVAAVDTFRNKLADIVALLRREQQHGGDLISEFAHGDFLSVADVVSLRDFCARSAACNRGIVCGRSAAMRKGIDGAIRARR